MNCTMIHWIYRIIPLTRRLTMASWPDSDVCLSVQTQLPLLRQQCQSKAWMHLLLISLTNGLKNSRATHPAFFIHLIRQVVNAYPQKIPTKYSRLSETAGAVYLPKANTKAEPRSIIGAEPLGIGSNGGADT